MKKFGMEIKQYIMKNKLTNIRSDVKRVCGILKQVWYALKNISDC